jgi:two-component sensor histidine kinase
VRIDDRGATPIALLVHELATNAIKYGSLSADDGRVDIAIVRDADQCQLSWVERGGPAIEAEPTHAGFGTRLAEMSIVQQLGGTLTRSWVFEGLEAQARVSLRALAR